MTTANRRCVVIRRGDHSYQVAAAVTLAINVGAEPVMLVMFSTRRFRRSILISVFVSACLLDIADRRPKKSRAEKRAVESERDRELRD